MSKLIVEIWSDVVCPFCYIGKRRFEAGLASFAHKQDVEVIWHSYQLDPDTPPSSAKDVYTYLAEKKGQTRDWSVKMHESVVSMAAAEGLEYNFHKARIANTFDAHRLIQFAKRYQLGDAMEERLFRAYFTEGALISDHTTLAALAAEAGLNSAAVTAMLAGTDGTSEVEADIREAAEIGISGVPFFVLDRKYAISGAQASATFADALRHAYDTLGK